jgi:heme-degrading monooxygenase HmoA
MGFQSVLAPYAQRPRAQANRPKPTRKLLYALRENFSVSTWMLFGAFLQSLVVLIIPRFYAMLPSLIILAARLADTLAITYGWKKNHYLDEAAMYRVSPQIPDENGNFHQDAAQEKVVVFLLGAKVNHPMGLLAPNVKVIGDYLTRMIQDIEKDNPGTGFYGGSSWSSQDKNGATELLFLSYWRSADDIHRFAYGDLHRDAWEWWNKTIADNDHLGINHEIFEVDRHHWEGIYVNFQPTGLGATTFLRKGDKMMGGTVDDQWISPLVDARRGKLRSSAGRLGRRPEELYEKHGLAPGSSYTD